MTRTVVFLGPSAPREAFAAIADVEFRPPARQGDVFRAVQDGAGRIGIVDGYFDSTPAVLHKEILWSIDSGVSVLGAASMGALRAAELHRFGMIGVGWVFEAFASGQLEDDDEVAIIHGPARIGFAAVSEAMVNIRRTLEQAIAEGIIARNEAERLVGLAKQTHYADREWPRLLAKARAGHAAMDIDNLAAWLPAGRIDIKRKDALELARRLSVPAQDPDPSFVRHEHTRLAEAVRLRAAEHSDPADEAEAARALIAQWRDQGASSAAHELLALVDVLLAGLARAGGAIVDEGVVRQAADSWREATGLTASDAVAAWLAQRGLSLEQLLDLFERDARLLEARDALGPLIDLHLAARLRFHHGLPVPRALERTDAALDWYCPGRDIPPSLVRTAPEGKFVRGGEEQKWP